MMRIVFIQLLLEQQEGDRVSEGTPQTEGKSESQST